MFPQDLSAFSQVVFPSARESQFHNVESHNPNFEIRIPFLAEVLSIRFK
jgi:hypothetical protein